MVTRFGAFTLDADRRQLFRNGAAVHLTPKAFDLLVLLVTNAPRVVSKRELHGQLWPETSVSDATLTGVIKELRRVLEITRRRNRLSVRRTASVMRSLRRSSASRHVPPRRFAGW